ncbi:short-subunit dehydrogenase [Jatrophihabitans sp. GAS493]|uniref:SDR family oxidoreductase n=1 Tax=Jatrophihabitans sp. GAS493 TaxID=1907575 RepID=UPI000BB82302|nr:SDR family oxidoreductase [Jatrophihabitans sp. GAS493]SOD71712.1 short-subunit dehydrogenase [Jatrophihabitans sp. GAS493]
MTASPKSIFISGAAKGIGRATAALFHSRGWRVGLFDIDADAVSVATAEIRRSASSPAELVSGALDVRSAEEWRTALATFTEGGHGSGVDVLMNNAGVLASGPFIEMDEQTHRRIVDINIMGVINGSKEGYPYLLAARGMLLNMCSASSFFGQPTIATYAATKAAVKSLTEALDLEWQSSGIKVRSLIPMFVATDMVHVDGDRMLGTQKFGVRLSAQDVAAAAWKTVTERPVPLRSPHRTVGRQTRLMAAGSAISPDWVTRQVVRRVSK